jgi:hypothetical protein
MKGDPPVKVAYGPKEVIWISIKYIVFTSKSEDGTVNTALYSRCGGPP